MTETFLPFCKPNVTESDIAAVADVLRSGWITTGSRAAALEDAFCSLTGARHAIAVCSATAGMHIYLTALGIGAGDEVITPSLTWVSTVNLITLLGATPVFVDVDRDNLMVSAENIRAAITPKTKLIIPVHFAGAPLDIRAIRAVAATYKIQLVEDAAHVLGSTYCGQPIGAGSDAIFSLQAIKNVTSAEGGVIVTDNDALAAQLRRLKFHGLGVDSFDRATHGRTPQAEVIEPGFKYNLPDMCAALALNQIQRLDTINGKRAELAAYYLHALRDVEEISPLSPPAWEHTHSWHLFVVRILKGSRDTFIAQMKTENIGCGLHFRAIHEQKYYREKQADFPLAHSLQNTEWNSARICSLPLFPDMTTSNVDRVVKSIKTVFCQG